MALILVLRTVAANRRSYNDFEWPETGFVECPDWDPAPECGHGLHGLAKGEGASSLLNWGTKALWQVVEVEEESIVKIDSQKVKFPRGNVLFTGARDIATSMIRARHPEACIVGGTATAGDGGTATAGDGGTATAGERGTLAIKWWDNKRYRMAIGYVGENGIEANEKYRLNSNHEFEKVESK